MALRAIIIILSIAASLFSCNTTRREEKEFEKQANKDIQLLDKATVGLLQSWNYTQRGKTSFWSRLSGNSSLYNCSMYPSVDTPKLSIYQIANFLEDFKSDLKVDTTYQEIEFIKVGGNTLKLFATDSLGQHILLATNLSLKKIFPERNPFDTLTKLTELKNKLNVIGITHENNLGGFIQFYFPDGQYILTFLPDSLLKSNQLNKSWKEEFSKGKRLKPNWNFRRLNGIIGQ